MDIIIEWSKGTGNKKYKVIVENTKTGKKRTIQFGDKRYDQYKDTGMGLYSHKDHLDAKRRKNYFRRHSGVDNKKAALKKELKKSGNLLNPKILSHFYLW